MLDSTPIYVVITNIKLIYYSCCAHAVAGDVDTSFFLLQTVSAVWLTFFPLVNVFQNTTLDCCGKAALISSAEAYQHSYPLALNDGQPLIRDSGIKVEWRPSYHLDEDDDEDYEYEPDSQHDAIAAPQSKSTSTSVNAFGAASSTSVLPPRLQPGRTSSP